MKTLVLLMLAAVACVSAFAPASPPQVVVLHWYASWCVPCQKMAPDYARFQAQDAAQATFVNLDEDKVDVDPNFQVFARYKRTGGIPQTVVLRDGVVVYDKLGRSTLGQLHAAVNQAVLVR